MFHHCAYGLSVEHLDIVAVDDSRAGQRILKPILQDLGIARLRTFSSPLLALEEMVAEPPNFLITDWAMEPMNGCDLIAAIRHISFRPLNPLPTLLVTAFATRDVVTDAMEVGATHILTKPYSAKTMRRRIEWVLADNRLLVQRGRRVCIAGMDKLLSGNDGAAPGGSPRPAVASSRTQPVRQPAARPLAAASAAESARPAAGSRDIWEI